MAQIEIAGTIVGIAVIRVLILVGALTIPVPVSLRVLQAMRPGIDGKHCEVMAEAMLNRCPERVVVGVQAIVSVMFA